MTALLLTASLLVGIEDAELVVKARVVSPTEIEVLHVIKGTLPPGARHRVEGARLKKGEVVQLKLDGRKATRLDGDLVALRTKQRKARVKLLPRQVKAELRYFGDSDKPFPTETVDVTRETLQRIGFLDHAYRAAKPRPGTGYLLSVPWKGGERLWQNLGWDLDLIRRLQFLRAEKVLTRLDGLRRQWEAGRPREFIFYSGGRNHPEGRGAWTLHLRGRRLSAMHMMHGGGFVDQGTVLLDHDRVWAALPVVKENRKHKPVPGEVLMRFIVIGGKRPFSVSLWTGEIEEDDPVDRFLAVLTTVVNERVDPKAVLR